MWFNNATIYHYEHTKDLNISAALVELALKPCPPHARFIYGWAPVFNTAFTREVAGCTLVCLGKEERVLPRSVVNRVLTERVLQLETQRGYAVKRAEKAQMSEDLEFELLPKAFCVQKNLFALFDHSAQRLIINTSSQSQAAQMLAMLRKSIVDLRVEPLNFPDKLALRFTTWFMHPETLPHNMQLASDCLLFSLEDENKRFNCKGYSTGDEEITDLLSKGLVAGELSLIWNERVQFTLTQELTFKRIKCLDILQNDMDELKSLEDPEQTKDASLVLLAGELRGLCNQVYASLL